MKVWYISQNSNSRFLLPSVKWQIQEWEGNEKIHSHNSGMGREWKKPIPIIREREGNEKKAFPKFGNGKGMKKPIPIIREGKGMKKSIPEIRKREVLGMWTAQPPTQGADAGMYDASSEIH